MEGFEKQIERLMELTAYQVIGENSRIMGQRRAFKIVDHKVMGNLSYFVHSVGFRGFVFRGFSFVTSEDLINRTQKTNPKNQPLGFVFFSKNEPLGFVF